MKVILACIADHAATGQNGKLNIQGIFDHIATRQVPAVHPQMFLVVRMSLEFEDNDRSHAALIELVDEDGGVAAKLEGAIALAVPIPPGKRAVINQVVTLRNVGFTRAGRYVFRISADGAQPFEVPFDVILLPSPAT